jgi:hypothetical protein
MSIHKFDEVCFTENALILIDIDDTTLYYEKNVDYFYNLNKQMYPSFNYDDLVMFAYNDYCRFTSYNNPSHTDLTGFNRLVERAKNSNSVIMFLTARNCKWEQTTKMEFASIGIDYDSFKVHYTNNAMSKGDYICKHIDCTHFKEVIFIDNDEKYIESVKKSCPEIVCHKFVRQPTPTVQYTDGCIA